MSATLWRITPPERAIGVAPVSTDRDQSGYCLRVSKQGAEGAERFGRYLSEFLARSSRFANASAFADAAGISRSAVSRWVNGKERPAAGALPKIAPLMGVTADQLFAIAYPELANEGTQPIPVPSPPDVPPAIKKLELLSEAQQKIVAGVIEEFLAANEARPSRRRRPAADTGRSDDERRAI